jgi:hypothetical protein
MSHEPGMPNMPKVNGALLSNPGLQESTMGNVKGQH